MFVVDQSEGEVKLLCCLRVHQSCVHIDIDLLAVRLVAVGTPYVCF